MTVDHYPPMLMPCEKVVTSRNRYGDWVEESTVDLLCHFREISTVRRGTHMEISDADAMIWFPAATDIAVGDTVRFDDVDYEIERLFKPRRLGQAHHQFIKCELKKQKTVS